MGALSSIVLEGQSRAKLGFVSGIYACGTKARPGQIANVHACRYKQVKGTMLYITADGNPCSWAGWSLLEQAA